MGKIKIKIKEVRKETPFVYEKLITEAPDLKRGDIKDKLEKYSEAAHPGSELESAGTRGMYRRRVGGALVGAVGGGIAAGPGGMIGGAIYGASAHGKGKGQTKDYWKTLNISYLIGVVGKVVYSMFETGSWVVNWGALWKWVSGIAGAVGEWLKYKDGKKDPTPGDKGAAGTTVIITPPADAKKESQKTIGDDWLKVVAIAASVVIVLGAK